MLAETPKPSCWIFGLDARERLDAGQGDRLFERAVDRAVAGRRGRADDVQVGGGGAGLVLDLQLAGAVGGVGQEQAVAVGVDGGGDAGVMRVDLLDHVAERVERAGRAGRCPRALPAELVIVNAPGVTPLPPL